MGSELDQLLQLPRRKWLEAVVGTEQWTTVYAQESNGTENVGIYCALVPETLREQALNDDSWDMNIEHARPSCAKTPNGVQYAPFGNFDGFEPLVILRSFRRLRPAYLELLEEFRLFHNLYHDTKTNEFIKIDTAGNEEVIARITDDYVSIKTIPLRQFLAIKERHLAIYVDAKVFSPVDLAAIPASDQDVHVKADDLRYSLEVRQCDFSNRGATVSRLLGKRLIAPLPKEKSGMWPYEEPVPQYADFIVGTTEAGDRIFFTCDERYLANYFGANPGAPHYLTPIFFRRDVLSKYYSQPAKFAVEDGYLHCGGAWGLQLDNDHEKYVIVYLGDLRHLPYEEQLYWRSFNVPPEGGVSEVNFRRSMLAEFTDPTRPDLVFRSVYRRFMERWRRRHGWDLLRPMKQGDEHHLRVLRVPMTNDHAEFDSLVLSLTKLLVDSINEEALVRSGVNPELQGSITKLEEFLTRADFPDVATHVKFLRSLQGLRSAGAAHRKGEKYERAAAAAGIGAQPLADVFARILNDASTFLRAVEQHFEIAT